MFCSILHSFVDNVINKAAMTSSKVAFCFFNASPYGTVLRSPV
jgi:hypothetical protein